VKKRDIAQIMAWVLSNHPNLQQKDMIPTGELWLRMFEGVSREKFEQAVMKVMARSEFFPTVAAISKALTVEADLTPIEAWGEVTRAMRTFGYVRPTEALNSMSPLTQQVVNAIGWGNICANEQPDVMRGQFMNHYATMVQRVKDMAVLPKGLRQSDVGMSKLSDSMKQMVDMLAGDEVLKIEGD